MKPEFWRSFHKHGWLQSAVLLAAFWTAVGLFFVLSQSGNGEGWRPLLVFSFSRWWVWGLLTPLIIGFDRRLPFNSQQLGRRTLVHLLSAPLWSLLFSCGFAFLSAAADDRPWLNRYHDSVRGIFWHVLIYMLIVGVVQVYLYKQRYTAAQLQMERLERNFSEARLNSLRMQLDPHFLFNTLNTISAQISTDPKLARRMIEHLGELLRMSLGPQSRQEVPLTEEVTFLERYLTIQKIRFGEKLKTRIEISPEACKAFVPSLFLQPLVENAIRHGISSRAAGGTVDVKAELLFNRLEVHILDDGIGLPAGWSLEQHKGLGLALTEERIAGLHPDGEVQFELTRRPSGGTEVKISFPYRHREGIAK